MTAFVPSDLTGLWRREVITSPGHRDDTTQVLWLQTRSWYADLRVRADRPNRANATGFADYTDAELIGLAATQGFAGELAAADGVCLWRRDLDFQPPGDSPDEARYAIQGDVMIEDGIHADYQEIWRRQADSAAPLTAYRLVDDDEVAGRAGLLVIAGGHFLEILDRPVPLPAGESLPAIVAAAVEAGERAAAEAALAMRITYGRLEAGGGRVLLSSCPWLEGRVWNRNQGRRWTLIDTTAPDPAP